MKIVQADEEDNVCSSLHVCFLNLAFFMLVLSVSFPACCAGWLGLPFGIFPRQVLLDHCTASLLISAVFRLPDSAF